MKKKEKNESSGTRVHKKSKETETRDSLDWNGMFDRIAIIQTKAKKINV